MKDVTLQITGMKCEGCAKAVREALASVPGVRRVDVDLAEARARVEGEDELREPALVAAVEEAGYAATAGPAG